MLPVKPVTAVIETSTTARARIRSALDRSEPESPKGTTVATTAAGIRKRSRAGSERSRCAGLKNRSWRYDPSYQASENLGNQREKSPTVEADADQIEPTGEQNQRD